MNEKKPFPSLRRWGLPFGAVLLTTLTGCIGYVDGPRAGGGYGAPPGVVTTFVAPDDYVYYPGYEVYYSSSRHQYAYRDGRNWVLRPAPRGVSVNVLQASPSVRMDFHDSPGNHHAAIARQYPKNWKPSGANQGRNDQRVNAMTATTNTADKP